MILMAKITFIEPGGEKVVVSAESGSLMEAAVDAGVDGIHGDCGGVCSCATCHVHIQQEWRERVGPASETEREILDLEDGATEASRLSCQIEVSESLDRLVVEVVEETP